VADDPERMTVARVNALLYLPGHVRADLERALRIPALSPGWRGSFQAMLDHEGGSAAAPAGNPGLDPPSGPPPAWPGFRPLRIARTAPESSSVVSIELEPADGLPLVAALGGQFVVLRLRPTPGAPPVLRSYSLSGAPSLERYRVSVKREPHGVASAYLSDRARVGDLVEVSAPRGAFTLREGGGRSSCSAPAWGRPRCWRCSTCWWRRPRGGTCGGCSADATATTTRSARSPAACAALLGGHLTSATAGRAPGPARDRFRRPRTPQHCRTRGGGVSRDADFYLCGPPAFLRDLTGGLAGWGRARPDPYRGVRARRVDDAGIAPAAARTPHPPHGLPGPGPLVSFARSGLAVPWNPSLGSLLELAEACDVPARWACRTGVCHSCKSGLISGSVGYDPEPLDPPAAGSLLICCSRPTGDVVLDL
jgi:ferredoxin